MNYCEYSHGALKGLFTQGLFTYRQVKSLLKKMLLQVQKERKPAFSQLLFLVSFGEGIYEMGYILKKNNDTS